ncbi:restriction endonuclease subunit S [Aeromonas rivipollensis]|uniref:restriction endonuclease subunit S n=1 Tax=Aeromonas rivipollensis TaxID=948519 RepID=UPI003D212100
MESNNLNIPSHWDCKPLVECTSNKNISYGIVQPGQHDKNGIGIIRVNNFGNGEINTSDVLKVTPEIESKFAKTRLNGGELLLTLVGSTGQTAIVPDKLKGWNVARAVAVIRPSNEVTAEWLNICLQSSHTKNYLDARANTTVQKTLNLKDVKDIPIPLPPKDERDKLECIAVNLNNKITLNRQINQTLEQMAQALFKSWFVDFDPVVDNALDAGFFEQDVDLPDELLRRAEARRSVREHGNFKPLLDATRQLFPAAFEECAEPSVGLGGWVPKGWQVQSIKDFANVTDFVANGSFAALKENVTLFDNPEYALYIRTTDFKNDFDKDKAKYIDKHAYDFLSKTKLSGAEVIISNVGDVGTVFRPPSWLGMPMTLGSNAIAISTRCLNDYLYFYFSSQAGQSAIDGIVSGSAQQKFNKTGFRSLRLLLPDNNVVTKFNEVYQDISLKIISNKQNIRHLEQLRDTLLPKLISGELRLDNIEADLTTEEVA